MGVRISPWSLFVFIPNPTPNLHLNPLSRLSNQCRCGRCPVGFHKADLPGSIPGSATSAKPMTRVSQCSVRFHMPRPSGATPEPATFHCNLAIARVSQCSVRSHKPYPSGATPEPGTVSQPNRPGTQTGKAVTLRAWRFCGFDSHLGHFNLILVFRCFWWHAALVERKIGFNSRVDLSVGVPFSARTLQPNLTLRAHGPMGRHRPGVAEIRVQFPVSPLFDFRTCLRIP